MKNAALDMQAVAISQHRAADALGGQHAELHRQVSELKAMASRVSSYEQEREIFKSQLQELAEEVRFWKSEADRSADSAAATQQQEYLGI